MQKNFNFYHTFHFCQNSIAFLNKQKNAIQFKKFNIPDENFAQSIIHSLINQGQLNLDACMKSIVQNSDNNNITTLQHKILYLTIHFFTSFQVSNENKTMWLIEWLSNAAKLFKKQKYKQQQSSEILELLYNGELENFLTELKILQDRQQKNVRNLQIIKPSLSQKIQFLKQIGFRKILTFNSKMDKNIDRESYQMETKQYLRQKNQKLFKNSNEENKILSKTLSQCLSILLGDQEFIKNKTKNCFFSYAKLYLLYVGDLQIQQLEKKFFDGKNKRIQPKSVQDYLIKMLKNKNFHNVFQISLSHLQPYFSYLMASLAFHINPKSKQILRNDSQYKFRIMLNMLQQSSKISYRVFLSTAKLYEQLENHKKQQFQEIQNLYYRYLPYDIVTSYDQVHQIRQIFQYMRQINMNQSYFRDYISNLLSIHLNQPITKYTLEVIMIDLLLYYPQQLDGYLLDSNLQIPFDYGILDRLKQLTGQKTQIQNKRVCQEFINHFQDFFEMQKLQYQNQNSLKGKILIQLMKNKKFQAKGQILRVGKKLFQSYLALSLQQKQQSKQQIINLKDSLKEYIEDMEYKQQYSHQLIKLKNMLY